MIPKISIFALWKINNIHYIGVDNEGRSKYKGSIPEQLSLAEIKNRLERAVLQSDRGFPYVELINGEVIAKSEGLSVKIDESGSYEVTFPHEIPYSNNPNLRYALGYATGIFLNFLYPEKNSCFIAVLVD